MSTTAESGSGRRGAPAPTPCRVRHWEAIAPAGEGTLTQVYRARPAGSSPDRPACYALKVLRPEWENDPRAVSMFRREALVGRKVAHPHLVSILAAGVANPPYFLVMPWLAGTSLAARLTSTPPPPSVALWIARQVAEALGALHGAQWMHGDVKPSNVFVSPEGHATLLDLGFARRTDRRESGVERCLTGTWSYLAPETAAGRLASDIRSDLYSLGVMLFEMLAGRLPFRGDTPEELARQHREARPPALESLAPDLPADAHRLVRELLSKEPLRRPQTPAEVVARLAPLEIATFLQRRL